MNAYFLNILLIYSLFSCTNEHKVQKSGNDQTVNDKCYAELNPILAFSDETDSFAITWSEKTMLGIPSLFVSNGITEMTIQDCAENYCQGTTIYLNELGLPIREISKNTNSLYFNYKQSKSGIITKKHIEIPDNSSLIFDYNYTKEITYANDSYFYKEMVSHTDDSKPDIYYKHINDSVKLFKEGGDKDHFDTLINAFSYYVSIHKIKSLWKIKQIDNKTIEVYTYGDIKIPGGEELGGPLIMKYKLNESNLISKIQYVNKYGLILKEVEVKYKSAK